MLVSLLGDELIDEQAQLDTFDKHHLIQPFLEDSLSKVPITF